MLNVQNAQIHLVEKGSGIPTLLLHGNPDSADMWEGVIARLSSQYRCYAPDLPGFGRSVAPGDFDCSLDNLARFIDDLVEAIGIREPLNLVIHDIGGFYGLAWAVKYPAKVRRLVIINTAFFSDYRWHFWGRVWRTPVLGEFSMLAMNWFSFLFELCRGSRKLTANYIRHAYSFVKSSWKRMVLRLYRATDPENFKGWEDELLKLTSRVPTQVLWGDHDPYISRKFAERFGAQQVYHFPDCGHWLPAEDPEGVAQRLMEVFV